MQALSQLPWALVWGEVVIKVRVLQARMSKNANAFGDIFLAVVYLEPSDEIEALKLALLSSVPMWEGNKFNIVVPLHREELHLVTVERAIINQMTRYLRTEHSIDDSYHIDMSEIRQALLCQGIKKEVEWNYSKEHYRQTVTS